MSLEIMSTAAAIGTFIVIAATGLFKRGKSLRV